MKKIECEKCGKFITSNNYQKHANSCNKFLKKEKFINEEWKTLDNKYKCPYCDKIFTKNGISTHIMRIHTNKELFVNCYKITPVNVWNKGLTKDNDERVKKNTDNVKNYYVNHDAPFKNKKHTDETKKIISLKLSQNNNGGKCKWFDFIRKNGLVVKLQGTWEVRFAKVLEVIDENWIKIGVGNNEHSFIWNDGAENHYYTPDFYSEKYNKYFEVKGYWWGNDKEKMEKVINQYPNVSIEIIRKKDLETYERLL